MPGGARATTVSRRRGAHRSNAPANSVDGTVKLLHAATQATVTLASRIPETHPSAPLLGTARFGTGAHVLGDGLVLTVNYVVLGADRVVAVDLAGRQHELEPVANDFLTGLSVLRLPVDDLPALPQGSSETLESGQDVFMVASAGQGERRSCPGVVTSLEGFDAYWEYRIDRAICSTVTNPGLGGAPLRNAAGELVGVASLNLGQLAQASMSIPSEFFFSYIEEFLGYGGRVSRARRAWLGMLCHEMPERTIVAGVIPQSPGESAGLMPGDLIVSVDDERLSDRAAVYDRIWSHAPGDEVSVGIYRDGDVKHFRLTAGDAEDFFA